MPRIFFLFLLIVFLNDKGYTQDASKKKNCNYVKDPCWIKMMDDPNTNYFEAQKAFDAFWKARGGEPFVSENAEERKKYAQKKRTQKEKNQEAEKQKYVIDYKRFKKWLKEVEPYVQEDGRILSEEERNKIQENQRTD